MEIFNFSFCFYENDGLKMLVMFGNKCEWL